jgi:hypothetical protein
MSALVYVHGKGFFASLIPGNLALLHVVLGETETFLTQSFMEVLNLRWASDFVRHR